MKSPRLVALLVIALITLGGTAQAAMVAIERATDDLRRDQGAATQPARIAALEAAIHRGEAASAGLRDQIDQLQSEKRSLERIQVILTSGLIGALVTAMVAIAGVLSNLGKSRAERELKELEILEKTWDLNARGVPLPPKLRATILPAPR